MKTLKYLVITAALSAPAAVDAAMTSVDTVGTHLQWRAEALGVVGSGDFAPYHISSLRHGRVTSARTLLLEGAVAKPMDYDRRGDFGFGVDLITDGASAVEYERYNSAGREWFLHSCRPSSARVQQIYAEGRWRSLFASLGMKEREPILVNPRLSSGDLMMSGNARPMPELRIGFSDFVDMPFTGGFLQVQMEVAVGKRMDDKWLRNHYNYFNYYLSQGEWMNYKRIYFRSDPSRVFSAMIGIQAVCEFWGSASMYRDGEVWETRVRRKTLGSFLRSIIPNGDGREGFCEGNHLGSLDVSGLYRLRSGASLKAYLSWPMEDGSGFGKLNGWDGLWGLEYRAAQRGWLNGLVIEYLNFTNHSGHIHLNPADWPEDFHRFPGHVSGSDDYYNHVDYNSYAYFGQSIGTPAMMAPIYNRDGYMRFVGNVMRGFHLAFEGSISENLDYIAKCSYRKAWGSGYMSLVSPIHLASFMVGADWRLPRTKGLKLNAQIEVDRGTMPGNAFGVALGLRWTGTSYLKLK